MSSLRLQTKADFQALMHTLLDPLKPFYSAGGARLRLGAASASYNRTAIEDERGVQRPRQPVLGHENLPFAGPAGRSPVLVGRSRPLPAAYTAPGLTLQPAAHLLLQRRPNGGVNLYAPAEVEKNDHGQFAEKYGKFCYSTRFGFSASRSYAQLAQAAPDSMLAFEIGGQIFVRRHSLRFEVRPDSLFSVWSPFPGITVETEIRPTPTGHIRRHKIHSEIACTAWDCGFAVPRYAPGYTAAAEDGAATAANAAVGCTVRGDGKAEVFNTWANTNLYDPNCAIPARRYAIHAGDSEWHCEIVEE